MAGQYENTHENRMVSAAIEVLQNALADAEDTYHLVCCFTVPGYSSRYRSNIDLAVIKPGGMMIVEMKDYTGPIDYGDEGEWYCELISGGIKEIKGGNNGRSPYRQVSDYRQQCRRLIERQQLSFLQPEDAGKRQFNARNWVSAMVLFPDVPEGTRPDTPTFKEHRDNWFHLVRMSGMAEAVLQQMSGRDNWLTGEEIEGFITGVLHAKPAKLIGYTPVLCQEKQEHQPIHSDDDPSKSADVPEIYNDLLKINSTGLSLDAKALALRDVFIQLTNYYAEKMAPTVTFTSILAKSRYLCRENMDLYRHVDRFRWKANDLAQGEGTFTDEEYRSAFRSVCEYASMLLQVPLPRVLSDWIASIEYIQKGERLDVQQQTISLRMVVDEFDDTHVNGHKEETGQAAETVQLDLAGSGDEFSTLPRMLYKGAVLSLATPYQKDGGWKASEIVLEPDRLLTPSQLGDLIEYANPGLRYILKLFENTEDHQKYFLRGNLANQFLADTISDPTIGFDESKDKFFRSNALALTTADLHANWNAEVTSNHANIQRVIENDIPESYGISRNEWLIEAPFVSPVYGLTGRMDLIHIDNDASTSIVFELKSGKWDTFKANREKLSHKVQCALYGDVLFVMHGIHLDHTIPLIYYALDYKFWGEDEVTHGQLFHSTCTRKEIRTIIHLRNSVVDAENKVMDGRWRRQIEAANPEIFWLEHIGEHLWTHYMLPEIARTLNAIQSADDLSRAYFYRFVEFLMLEDVIARTGGRNMRTTGGYARAWLDGIKDRQLAGTVLWALGITDVQTDENGMVAAVEFDLGRDPKNMGSSIRKGDSVYLYEAGDARRNISNSVLFAGYIESLSANRVRFVLENAQQVMFIDPNKQYALESAFMSGKSGYKGAYALLTGNSRRRNLILGRDEPKTDERATLDREEPTTEPEMNELLLRVKQAKDYFILRGPPGTGKTSYAMKHILNEALCNPDSSVLLLAYTHRAVDEICKMLDDREEDDEYLRIGSEKKCDEQYRERLIQNQGFSNCDEVRDAIEETRIIVGTVSSVTAEHDIFKLKTFSMAIVDEASQVLEPQILSIFCGEREGHLLVDKFVFVGDDKQLPAVVQQTARESSVQEESLRSVGLTNCRNSIFERLRKINGENPSIVGQLRCHWRMHPLISEFCNRFYDGVLVAGGAPHQLQEHPHPNIPVNSLSEFEKVVVTQRVALFPITKENVDEPYKVNGNEAKCVARIIHILCHICGQKAEEIGVVVPFRNQIAAIRSALAHVDPGAKPGWSDDVVIDTIERYQGSGREVILFSTVVSKEAQCELLSENVNEDDPDNDEGHPIDRKLNVAVSRSKNQFFVIGDPNVLQKVPIYDELMAWLQKRGVVLDDD